ncbi:hypothetical protein [Candidatus Chlorohelix sp.]|uniref:hypothetical protein n=1 Tax=Candidatus Chlorohelix sp. TaxID=3139201 RepID=UPI0030392023
MLGKQSNDKTEIILCLWYVRDEEGLIYSLRARLYAYSGTDQEKLAFLQERALLDYLVADPFEIPKRFHVTIHSPEGQKCYPVAYVAMVTDPDSPLILFEDALKELDKRLPSQTTLPIPEDPLFCMTPLMQNRQGVLKPHIEGYQKFTL